MDGQAKALDRDIVTARGENVSSDIVSGHLAARRRERRVIALCSVLVVCGLMLLVGVVVSGKPVVRIPLAGIAVSAS